MAKIFFEFYINIETDAVWNNMHIDLFYTYTDTGIIVLHILHTNLREKIYVLMLILTYKNENAKKKICRAICKIVKHNTE